MTTPPEPPRRRPKINWAPYLLILPSLLYLVIFFAWPMARGLTLAVWDEDAALSLQAEPAQESVVSGQLPQGMQIAILDQQGNLIPAEELAGGANLLTEVWFRIRAEDAAGQAVEGWASESRIRVREEAEDGTPLGGTVRTRIGSDEPTTVYAEPNESSEPIGQLEAQVPVQITEQAMLEIWYQISGEDDGQVVEGWAPSRFIQVFGDEETGRIDRGNTGQLTTQYIQRMVNDRFFMPALTTTLLLMVIILPIQFILAIIMALIVQTQLRGSEFLLYIFAIPLAASDLAVGILWYAIFTQRGFLNTLLQSLGLIDTPIIYLSADERYWIIIVICLAEVWRATSIVMVIVVSGLQAISQEVLEAAEIFGATFWQRVRHVSLPLLRPSLQVALILRTILALQVFAVVIALSGGDVVTVLANETYRQYNDFRNANVAAAYAGFILLISMFTAIFYLRTIRTQEELAA
jgi:multiple sugar transport system permease protein